MIRRTATAAIWACVFLSVLRFSSATAAPVYKWVDERGTIHFTDAPPERSRRLSGVEVIPEDAKVPVVHYGPPPSAVQRSRRGAESEVDLYEEAEPEEFWPEQVDLGAESTSVIVVEGARDPSVRFRALSPLNRPGQPIRVHNQRPCHHRK